MSDEQFIDVKINLPDHKEELKTAKDHIEKIKYQFKFIVIQDSLNDKTHEAMYEEIVRVLDYVGRLSMHAFKLEGCLEEMYFDKYRNSPKLAKHLWLQHYEEIHSPYNLLKNRCFKLLNDLDKAYINKFKKHPPNWKI